MNTAEMVNNNVEKYREKCKMRKAVKARESAQKFVFSPMLFYAVAAAKDLGILDALAEAGSAGLDFNELLERGSADRYVLRLLLDSNLSADVIQRENSRYSLSDMGYFVLYDPMTEINYNFVKDVCYRAMPFLQQSLMEGRPAGLQTLGSWSDVYQGLANLPETARQSWFEFDHYYSDSMFSQAIPLVFDRPVERLLDVGANTGNWARRCLRYDSNVEITLVDLPPQLSIAKSCFSRSEQLSRIDFLGINVLEDDVTVWKEYDVIWMSQFLDCFDERGIECVLNKFSPFLATGGRLIVVELFADRQKFQAATLSLNATSLYFCCVANGNSRFYQYDEFCEILYRSGYNIDRVVDFTSGHTALVCKRRL